MIEETIFIIMCRQPDGNEFAWEADWSRSWAEKRMQDLLAQNPRCQFWILKTKLVG